MVAASLGGPVLIVLALGAGACQHDRDPCENGAPGIRVIVHTPIEANPPAELGVEYAGGGIERFDDLVNAITAWPDPLVIDLPYSAAASEGVATVVFSSRPDPYRSATATVDVDLDRCVSVEMTLMTNADGGL